MKKGGSKSAKQQAAIAISMKAAGKKPKKMQKGGSFPDLTGDGKVTRADILKGRGVFKKGGSIGSSKKPKMQVGGTVKKSKVRPVPMPEVGTRKGTPSVRMPEFGTPKGTPPVPMREFPSFSSKRSKSPSDIGKAVGRALDAIPSVGNSSKGFKKAVPREVEAARSTEKGISYKRGGSIGKSKKKK